MIADGELRMETPKRYGRLFKEGKALYDSGLRFCEKGLWRVIVASVAGSMLEVEGPSVSFMD